MALFVYNPVSHPVMKGDIVSSERWKMWGVMLLGAIPVSAIWSIFTADEPKDFFATLAIGGIFLLPIGIICLFQGVSAQIREDREAASYLALQQAKERSRKSARGLFGIPILTFGLAMLFGVRFAKAFR